LGGWPGSLGVSGRLGVLGGVGSRDSAISALVAYGTSAWGPHLFSPPIAFACHPAIRCRARRRRKRSRSKEECCRTPGVSVAASLPGLCREFCDVLRIVSSGRRLCCLRLVPGM